MSREYNYDEQGQFFPYFVLTVLGLVLVPLTYSTFAPSKGLKAAKQPLVNTGYVPPGNSAIEAAKRKQAKRDRRIKRFVSILAGWSLFGYMAYLVATTKLVVGKVWDPYEILGVSMSASEKAIKKHYRSLARKFHPDKVRPKGNETAEMLNSRFVEMTKAYKALTDEEIRNNYIMYGHPDGKQAFTMGIALPKWIIAEGNTYYVLAVYGIIFGILLPYAVGKWWYGTKRYTKDGVLVDSAGKLFKAYPDVTDERRLVEAFSLGAEYKEAADEWVNLDWTSIEKKVQNVIGERSMKKLQELEEGPQRQALALLWAYLYRLDLGNDKANMAKLEVAPIAMTLNNSFLAIALACGNTPPILFSMHASQSLVQAIAPGESPLLQLPGFTPAVVSAIEHDSGKAHWTIQRFMSMSNEKRRKSTIGKDLLTETEYDQAITFAKKLPALHVEAAFFKVTGEKFVTVGSLVQFVVKARIIAPGQTPKPVNEADLVDEDYDETDVDFLIGRKAGLSRRGANDQKKEATRKVAPLAHAPYYPRDYSARWHLFLTDAKQGRVVIPPTAFTALEKENGEIETLKLQFQAPPQKGEYTFVMHLVNDAYLGIDTKMNVRMIVEGQEKVSEMAGQDDDISEPEEDSIAGQMSAMRGVQTKKKKKTADSDEDSDEDESDTDGEKNAQSDSETNTDTEDES